jgi:hypothetical protein
MINRMEPKIGPEAFKTYAISAPISTHRRRATCAEVECIRRIRGFKAVFDVSTPEGRKHAHFVEISDRNYSRTVTGSLVTYVFAAGQDCFDKHTVTLEREPLYIVKGGDHRGNPLRIPTMRHAQSEHWVEDFAEHQENIVSQQQRG